MDIVELLKQNWSIIAQTPWVFVGMTVVVTFVVWAVVNHLKANQIETLSARLVLRDDEISDYKRKLSGASPSEAKARIEALEQAIARMSPRRILPEQITAFISVARASQGTAYVAYDGSYAAGAALAGQIQRALTQAGWMVHTGVVLGPEYHPPEGILVCLRPSGERTPQEQAFVSAMEAAKLPFAVAPIRPSHPHMLAITLTQPAS